MICDLTHGMKETKQGTMALVQVHVDLFTTTHKPNKSVEAYYRIFCARRDTVNAHGREAGYHKKLYKIARNKILVERGRDEAWITSAAGDATAAAKRKATYCEACKESLLQTVPRGAVHQDSGQRTVLGPEGEAEQRFLVRR